jgi:hypothetical protein
MGPEAARPSAPRRSAWDAHIPRTSYSGRPQSTQAAQ